MEIVKIVQDGIELDVIGSVDASSITQDADNRFVTDTEKTTWNNKQDKLTPGTNVAITGTTISATDTVYDDTALKTRITAVENREDKDTTYTAGTNVQISTGNVISATDTKYTAGTNVTISGNTISATDTTYGVASASANGLMSSAMFSKLNAVPSDNVKRNVILTQAAYDALSTAEKGRADTVYFTNG